MNRYVIFQDKMASSSKYGGWRLMDKRSGYVLRRLYQTRAEAQKIATRMNAKERANKGR